MKSSSLFQGFDHLEFFVGNAKQAAFFYTQALGFRQTAYRGPETGDQKVVSYLLEQGQIRLVLSSALNADHAIARDVALHGDTLAVLAFEVTDAEHVYRQIQHKLALNELRSELGAMLQLQPPTVQVDASGEFKTTELQVFGNVSLKFIERSTYDGYFAPYFVASSVVQKKAVTQPLTQLQAIDHLVANVEAGAMDRWVQRFEAILGFELVAHFDQQMITTGKSALASKVVQTAEGQIKIPINEPAVGKRASQIQEFLDYHAGPGIQHVAFKTQNIIESVRQLRAAGVQFLTVPATYYAALPERINPLPRPLAELAELGILVDRDRDGYLLQIFTQPVGDRPTLFFEIIERQGSQGFGEGNFNALFAAIEREQARRGHL